MGNMKEINIKNRTCYFFYDTINIEDFGSNLLKIDKKSHKNINIYYIGFITMKDSDYVKINSVKFNSGFDRYKQRSINEIPRTLQ